MIPLPSNKVQDVIGKGTSKKKKKIHQSKSVGKVLLVAFSDLKCMVYYHYVPTTNPKTMVNSEYYMKVLQELHKHV